METRSLTIFNALDNGCGEVQEASFGDVEYAGIYFEDYEKGFRIGYIYDLVKNKIIVFRQTVTSRDDIVPHSIGAVTTLHDDHYLMAWGTDPKNADPRSSNVRCQVMEFKTREPTPEDMDRVNSIRQTPAKELDPKSDMLTIRKAAEYAKVDERTIRDWLKRGNGAQPMLPGAILQGRKIRIPRTALDPWRKDSKTTHTPKSIPRKRLKRKTVKRKT